MDGIETKPVRQADRMTNRVMKHGKRMLILGTALSVITACSTYMVIDADGVESVTASKPVSVTGDVEAFKRVARQFEPHGEIRPNPPLDESFANALSALDFEGPVRIIEAEANIFTALAVQRVDLNMLVEHDDTTYSVSHEFEPEEVGFSGQKWIETMPKRIEALALDLTEKVDGS